MDKERIIIHFLLHNCAAGGHGMYSGGIDLVVKGKSSQTLYILLTPTDFHQNHQNLETSPKDFETMNANQNKLV